MALLMQPNTDDETTDLDIDEIEYGDPVGLCPQADSPLEDDGGPVSPALLAPTERV